MRGRPRKYDKKEVRIRITLPTKVLKWLANEAGAIRRSVPEAIRFIIVGKYEAEQGSKK